jgi:sugar lactone lactonase YvrE
MKYFTHLLSICILAACGGGGGGGSAPANVVSSYSLGGSIAGLGGATGLTLVNGTETLSVSANATAFTFANKVTQGANYNVTVTSHPSGLACSINDGTGTMPGANVTNIAVKCVALPTPALFAGSLGGPGSADGLGAAARFNYPQGIASDSSGNLYVADTENFTIRKITPAGVVSTIAGTPGSCREELCRPGGIAIDSAGNLYVLDTRFGSIRKITPAGVVSTIVSGLGLANYIAVDNMGNTYVTGRTPPPSLFRDGANFQTVRKITPAGVVSTLAGALGVFGSADGIGANARFSEPTGLTTDSAGNVYVYDLGNNIIRKITPAGVVSTLVVLADNGSTDSISVGIAIDGAGNLYVTQNGTIRKINPAGYVTPIAGSTARGWTDGVGAAAEFKSPTGITTDSAGNIYVTDTSNHTIRKITPTGSVSTLAGDADKLGYRDGVGATASFSYIAGITADRTGNLYVADSYNCLIRKITPTGLVSTLAGTLAAGEDIDGLGAAASFSRPNGIAADSNGNLYVAEHNTIRKITPAGLVSTLAGTTAGLDGSADGIGAAARFNYIDSIATDSAGNLYASDTNNSTIRKITPGGVVSTLAGTAGVYGSADGIGAAASFYAPRGITIDNAGNLYVVDSENSTIRKITPAGVVSTLAGTTGEAGYVDGVGARVRFNKPQGIAIDSAGNLYVADTYNYAIRKITPAGVVSSVVATTGSYSFALGSYARAVSPTSLTIIGNNLYISTWDAIAVVTIQP